MPNEKAHGYQIVQMCEAFALAGQTVTLVVPMRWNTEKSLRGLSDVWGYYGVRQNFKIARLPCIDLIGWLDNRFALLLMTVTFILSLFVWLPFQGAAWLFSRDLFIMTALAAFFRKDRLIYEIHSKAVSGRMQRLQGWMLGRVGHVVSLTGAMAEQLHSMGREGEIIVAHDAVRPERFADQPSLSAARARWNLPQAAFVACYTGRLHTMEMDKGLGIFVDAARTMPDIVFLLAGGPPEGIESLQAAWADSGLPPAQFISLGSLPPADIPSVLAASDVCLITSPQNEFFAYETSPMKLFEYMSAGRAIIASDLPSTREVVRHGDSAYLIPPSNPDALAHALRELRDQPDLRQNLGRNAAQAAQRYTWEARARHILSNISETSSL